MAFCEPYVRPAGDGTYEVLVPVDGLARPYVLPYSFHTAAAAIDWINSAKGIERINEIRKRFELAKAYSGRSEAA
jgi:hypothetical protein